MDPSLTYDYFVKQEAGLVEFAFAGGPVPAPPSFAHQTWRRLLDGYTLGDILADILQYPEIQVVGGHGVEGAVSPPAGLTYDGFLLEQQEIADTLTSVNGAWSAQDLAHNAWRRLVERGPWTHENLLHDINGEPLDPVEVPQPPIDPIDPPIPPQPIEPPIGPPTPGLSRGPSRLDGRVWCLADGTPYLPQCVHFMEGFSLWTRNRTACIGQLNAIASACAGTAWSIRFLDTLGYYNYWKGREVAPLAFTAKDGYHVEATPNYYGQLTEFLGYIKGLGGLVRWSRGDLQMFPSEAEIQLHVERGADALDTVGASVLEHWTSCNEGTLNGCETPEEAAEYADAFKDAQPDVLVGLGAPYGTEESEELIAWAEGADFGSVHGYRPGNDSVEEAEKTLRHLFSVRREGYGSESGTIAICQDEPTGPGDDVSGGRTTSVELLTLLAVMSHTSAQAWTYMSGYGVRHNGPIESQPGFHEVIRTVHALPADLYRWHIFRGGNSENPFTSDSGYMGDSGVTHGPGRIDGASQGMAAGQFIVLVYGGKAPRIIRAQHDVEFTVWHPADDSRTGPITMHTGDTYEVTYQYGRVLVGKFL